MAPYLDRVTPVSPTPNIPATERGIEDQGLEDLMAQKPLPWKEVQRRINVQRENLRGQIGRIREAHKNLDPKAYPRDDALARSERSMRLLSELHRRLSRDYGRENDRVVPPERIARELKALEKDFNIREERERKHLLSLGQDIMRAQPAPRAKTREFER